MATQYLEDLIVRLLSKTLEPDDVRPLHTWIQVVNHIDEESREEMKEALFTFVLERINTQRVIRILKEDLPPEDEEEEEDCPPEGEDDDGY